MNFTRNSSWTRRRSTRSCVGNPHTSHRLAFVFDPDRDDDHLLGGADLDDTAGRFTAERLAFDNVFPLMSSGITLPFDYLTCENDVFNVENADVIVIQFVGSVEWDEVTTSSDLGPKTMDDPPWHWPRVLA